MQASAYAYLQQLAREAATALPELRKVAAKLIENEIAPYPSAPNYAGRQRWYERGYGPRWRRKSGGIGGRKTSQRLNTRWRIVDAAHQTKLVNTASYSGYVHRTDPARKMPARIHVQRGWVQDKDAVARAMPQIVRVFEKTLGEML